MRFSARYLVLAVVGAAAPGVLLGGQREASSDELVKQLDAVVNLKQLALAMNVYAADYDDVYPNVRDIKTLKVVTYPYVKTKEAWKTANLKSEFRFNSAIGGVARRDVRDPAGTVMFYESRPWSDGRRGVAFVDGTARLVATHDWVAASLSLLANIRKTAAPLPESIGKTWKD